MSLAYLTTEALEAELSTLAARARELKGKTSTAARHEIKANAERFSEISRELNRRKQ